MKITLIQEGRLIEKKSFNRSRWDVIVGAKIEILQEHPKYIWGASLLYTNLGEGDEYRWWETLYMHNPIRRSQPEYQPYALEVFQQADLAASPGMNEFQLAANPTPIDDECIDDFCSRWSDLLAKAYLGKIQHPIRLPLD